MRLLEKSSEKEKIVLLLLLKINPIIDLTVRYLKTVWNDGYASGTIAVFEKKGGNWVEIDTLDGEMGGCEYGEYND